MFEKVCTGIFMVGGSELSDPSDCMCYALDLGEPVLIDCGCGPGWSRIKDNISEAGLDASIGALVITHAHVDHMGAAYRVRQETACKVIAHELDAKAIETADEKRTAADWYGIEIQPTPVDEKITSSEHSLEFSGGKLHLLHTPGHTPGSMVAWLDTPDGRVLFGQDIHGPFSPAFGSDISAWRESMQRLLALEPDILCEGHFGIYRGKQEVAGFIESHLRRHR